MTARSDGGRTDRDAPSIDAEDGWVQAAQRSYDPDRDGELTTAIVYALAGAEGVPPTEVRTRPLYEVVDAPALEDAFFGPDVADRCRQGVGTAAFRFDGYLVRVRSDGWIRVFEADGDA